MSERKGEDHIKKILNFFFFFGYMSAKEAISCLVLWLVGCDLKNHSPHHPSSPSVSLFFIFIIIIIIIIIMPATPAQDGLVKGGHYSTISHPPSKS